MCSSFCSSLISDGRCSVCVTIYAAASTGDDGEQNLDLSLGSSAGSNKRGSLDGDDDGTAGSDQRVPMAFELDWQTAARSTKAKVHR
jgi:AP2-like factor (euAP2 lineage)